MCSAVTKGYLCSDKEKVIRKFDWINRIFWDKKGRSEIVVQLLRSKCAVMNFP